MNYYVLSQGGKRLAYIEAPSLQTAQSWSKGLEHLLRYSPSLPLSVICSEEITGDIPVFHADYFELLGYLPK